ncbi:ESPR-type extended signal peptide-containing protein [Neisseria leonii]|uniref:ESPR-type extended signal peptide-containing protein n=1 Tax=Neisseria leonii TaxID=2995413 RepID=UPI0030CE99A4
MNHIYKVVFNKSSGVFTAVAEFAKAQGKSANCQTGSAPKAGRRSYAAFALTAIASGILLMQPTHANTIRAYNADQLIFGAENRVEQDSSSNGSPLVVIGRGNTIRDQGAYKGNTDEVDGDAPWDERTPSKVNVIGVENTTNGDVINVFGSNNQAEHNAVIVGFRNTTNRLASVLGQRNRAEADSSSAVGFGNIITNNEDSNGALAYGYQNQVDRGAAAIGISNKATGKDAVAFGYQSTASGQDAYAIGRNVNVGQNNSFALGRNIRTTQANSVVLGNESADRAATAERSISVNNRTYNFAGVGGAGKGVVSVGKAGGERQLINVAAGQVSATSTDAINGSQLYQVLEVVKNSSTPVPDNYFHVNTNWTDQPAGNPGTNYGPIDAKGGATGEYALAAGVESAASGLHSTAVGYQSKVRATDSTVIGYDSQTNDQGIGHAIVGSGNRAYNEDDKGNGEPQYIGASILGYKNSVGTAQKGVLEGVAVGYNNQIQHRFGNAMGSGNQVKGIASTAIGYRNVVGNGDTGEAIAIGALNKVTGNSSVAIGRNNTVSVENSYILGSVVNATQANSVVLGAGSTDRAATTESRATLNGLTYGTFAGQGSPDKGVVSVGKAGGERQLINVAAGRIASDSTDAINGSQLYATNQVLGNAANAVVQNFGGNARLNPNKQGDITFTDIGGTGKNTVHEAVAAARTEVQSGKNTNVAAPASGANGQKIYKVDAWDTTVRAGDGISVSPDNNQTAYTRDYTIALSQQVKDDINKGKAAKDAVDTKGITFNGDSGTDVTRKLGEALAVKGNAKNARDLTDGNIGVVSSAADNALYVKFRLIYPAGKRKQTGIQPASAGFLSAV